MHLLYLFVIFPWSIPTSCSFLVEMATFHWELNPTVCSQSTPRESVWQMSTLLTFACCGYRLRHTLPQWDGLLFMVKHHNIGDLYHIGQRPLTLKMAMSWRNNLNKNTQIYVVDHLSARKKKSHQSRSAKGANRDAVFAGNKSAQELERTIQFKCARV